MHSVEPRLLAGALAGAAAAAAGPASAAPAAQSTGVRVDGHVLFVTSIGTQDNHIFMNHNSTGDFTVSDRGALVFPTGGGCTSLDAHTVTCPRGNVTRAVVDSDAGDDFIGGAPGTQNELHGGAGDDELDGADQVDTLDGGPGDDILAGAGGIDLADYRGRTNGVTVTLDGIDNDGEPGEHDDIRNNVEGV